VGPALGVVVGEASEDGVVDVERDGVGERCGRDVAGALGVEVAEGVGEGAGVRDGSGRGVTTPTDGGAGCSGVTVAGGRTQR